jgi:hypothetical protein
MIKMCDGNNDLISAIGKALPQHPLTCALSMMILIRRRRIIRIIGNIRIISDSRNDKDGRRGSPAPSSGPSAWPCAPTASPSAVARPHTPPPQSIARRRRSRPPALPRVLSRASEIVTCVGDRHVRRRSSRASEIVTCVGDRHVRGRSSRASEIITCVGGCNPS